MAYKVNDVVCFKSDVEQCGRIAKIKNGTFSGRIFVLHAISDDGFSGDYLCGLNATEVAESEVWVED